MQEFLQYFTDAFSQFYLRDIIDILIVTFLIYHLLKLTRQTRAIQVLKGLGVVFACVVLSDWLQLDAINWVLNLLISNVIIVAVVLFQPELRRILERLGRSKVLSRPVQHVEQMSDSRVTEALVRAAQRMSKSRTGALIVLERKTRLGDIIETGTPVDALVTDALLLNIFEPDTPLHDGAVIIRDQRLAAAGCFLPLTMENDISKDLGTRHRAALGVSEASDALCIIVSEETGVISVAQEGKLTRYLDPQKLTAMINSVFSETGRPAATRGRWRNRHE